MPAEEGFPAYLPTRLAEFYERGGRVETMGGTTGSVSIIGAVSPPGGDFSEPVTQHTKRFIRCFWALDRDLANARHYPRHLLDRLLLGVRRGGYPVVGTRSIPEWRGLRGRCLELLKREQRLEQIVRLIGPDALPDEQRLILMTAEIIKNGFLQQSSFDEVDKFCAPQKQVLLLRAILEFHRRAEASIKAGAPLLKISALPIRERLSRVKSEVPNEALHDMRAIEDQIGRGLRRPRPAVPKGGGPMRGLEHRGLASADGPIVIASRTEAAGYGEIVAVFGRDGQRRIGRVVDSSEKAVAVQLFSRRARGSR